MQQVRELSAGAFVLRFDRDGLEFEPGQYLNVGVKGDLDMREYSIYSGPGDDYLEILVKEVEGGYVSRRLRKLGSGGEVTVEGPFGFFVTQPEPETLCYACGNCDMIYEVFDILRNLGVPPEHLFAEVYF